jgi:hypothetical protein
MNTTIESIKDEVSKEYSTSQKRRIENWEDAISEYCKGYLDEKVLDEIINRSIRLYHTRKCEEAGKDLPDSKSVPHYHHVDSNEVGAEWMKSRAIPILASFKIQLDAKNEEREAAITQLNNGWDADRNNLSNQLKQAKEEAEKLRARLRNHECLSCGSGNLAGGYLKICKDCGYRQ